MQSKITIVQREVALKYSFLAAIQRIVTLIRITVASIQGEVAVIQREVAVKH